MADSPHKITVDNETEIVCPFCGGKVMISSLDEAQPFILHLVPACATYVELDANEFIHQAAAKAEERMKAAGIAPAADHSPE